MILKLYLHISFDEIKFPLISPLYIFVMLREVYTTGRLRDFSNSEGCRRTRKKKEEKICSINHVYWIIEFIDKMIKTIKKFWHSFKAWYEKEELIVFIKQNVLACICLKNLFEPSFIQKERIHISNAQCRLSKL